MDDSTVRSLIEKHFDRQAMKNTVVKIARTPCPQTELYEREPLLHRAIQTFYRPTMEALGCDTWMDDYGNLFASQGESSSGNQLLFLSYVMAWTEGTMLNPWSGEILDGARLGKKGEVVWGRGGSEYHGTNAALIECARIIRDSGVRIPGKITYVFSSAGHTSSSDPVFHLLHNDQLKADMCVTVGRPVIELGNTGRLDLKVNVKGKSVHSGGEIEVGINAIEGGLKVIERLQAIMPFPPEGKTDPEMGKGRLSLIGLASYPPSPGFHQGLGSGGHTLQNLMRILLDRRLVPGESVEGAIDEIKRAIGDLAPWQVTFERGALQYPTKHDKNSPIVKSLAQAWSGALQTEPEYGYFNETIDAGYMNMFGIPTVMYGAFDMSLAHGDTDVCQLDMTYDLARVLTFWAISNAR
jgi:acetylornithine deacetylase/succinyl-diaminopimelate desuccinylase-like protein